MKNKNSKIKDSYPAHHITAHIRVERFFRHRTVLSVVLGFMVIGLMKYETGMLALLHQFYGQGFGLVSSYAQHDEIIRMPVSYGVALRENDIASG